MLGCVQYSIEEHHAFQRWICNVSTKKEHIPMCPHGTSMLWGATVCYTSLRYQTKLHGWAVSERSKFLLIQYCSFIYLFIINFLCLLFIFIFLFIHRLHFLCLGSHTIIGLEGRNVFYQWVLWCTSIHRPVAYVENTCDSMQEVHSRLPFTCNVNEMDPCILSF